MEKVPKLTTKEINTVAVGAHLAMRTGAYELASELYSILKIGDDEIQGACPVLAAPTPAQKSHVATATGRGSCGHGAHPSPRIAHDPGAHRAGRTKRARAHAKLHALAVTFDEYQGELATSRFFCYTRRYDKHRNQPSI